MQRDLGWNLYSTPTDWAHPLTILSLSFLSEHNEGHNNLHSLFFLNERTCFSCLAPFIARRRNLKMMATCLSWVPAEADPETRIQVQVIYSGVDFRKHQEGAGKWDGEGKQPVKGGLPLQNQSSVPLGKSGKWCKIHAWVIPSKGWGSWGIDLPTSISHWLKVVPKRC